MPEREEREKKHQRNVKILALIGKMVDVLAYVILFLIFFSQTSDAMSHADFITIFEVIIFLTLFFSFAYGIARLIGFLARKIIQRIADIFSRMIFSDYEAYKEKEAQEEFRENFEEAEREREKEESREENREESVERSEDTELMRDLRLFGLSLPFSKEELRKRYIEVMKRAHPDNGGSDEMAKEASAARDRLERYAAG